MYYYEKKESATEGQASGGADVLLEGRFSWNNFPCRGLDIADSILFGELLYSRIEQDRFELMNRCLT